MTVRLDDVFVPCEGLVSRKELIDTHLETGYALYEELRIRMAIGGYDMGERIILKFTDKNNPSVEAINALWDNNVNGDF